MAVDDLARADPIPRMMSWLEGHSDVVAALGGSGRVGPYNEAPYPRLRLVDTPGGSDEELRWLLSPEVEIAAYGDLDGNPGKAALRRIMYIALGALMELPSQPPSGDYPVITDVRSSRPVGYVPEPTGQPRYLAAVRVFTHPA